MTRIILSILLVGFAVPGAVAQRSPTAALIDGVERKLERMEDLSADFVHIYEDPLNRTYREEGHLYLRRPRMMRWEYRTPEEYLYVSDGETVYLYVPADEQVNRESVDDSFDDRIPLMFLLGRSELSREFERIELLSLPARVAGARVLRMYPARESDVEELLLEVDPVSFDIRRLRIAHRDGGRTDFLFDGIESNTGLERSLFDFEVPPGVELVDGIGH